jgi:hypothetical protein
MSQPEIPTVTVEGKTYNMDELSDTAKELLALYEQAQAMALDAKRKAVVNDLALESITAKIKVELAKD